MRIAISYGPAHAIAAVQMEPGENLRAESGTLVSMTPNLAVTTEGPFSAGTGGILNKLKRSLLGGQSLFTNVYRAVNEHAHVSLAPPLSGDMTVHDLLGGEKLYLQATSFVAAPDTVKLDTKFQGFKGLVTGESLFFIEASGHGPVIAAAFGGLAVREFYGEMIVDTGHLVGFTQGVNYEVVKAGSGWISSWLSGEGLVLKLSGRGRVYLQSRNPREFGRWIGRRLPPRKGNSL